MQGCLKKGNSDSHGARPVHLIISTIKWIRTSRLSVNNSFSVLTVRDPSPETRDPELKAEIRRFLRNSKSETRDTRHKTRHPNPQPWNLKPCTRVHTPQSPGNTRYETAWETQHPKSKPPKPEARSPAPGQHLRSLLTSASMLVESAPPPVTVQSHKLLPNPPPRKPTSNTRSPKPETPKPRNPEPETQTPKPETPCPKTLKD